MELTKKDFKLEWFSGSGAGGQHRNKHANCCRITHIESGLKAQSTRHKNRSSNQKEAFNALVGKIMADNQPENERNHTQKVIRTYHFERGVADDGDYSQPIDRTMDGDLENFIIRGITGARKTKYSGRM